MELWVRMFFVAFFPAKCSLQVYQHDAMSKIVTVFIICSQKHWTTTIKKPFNNNLLIFSLIQNLVDSKSLTNSQCIKIYHIDLNYSYFLRNIVVAILSKEIQTKSLKIISFITHFIQSFFISVCDTSESLLVFSFKSSTQQFCTKFQL